MNPARTIIFYPPKLSGKHVLTLDSASDAFRVFASGSTNGTPLLVAGQSATNGLPPDIWVETLAHGIALLRYALGGTDYDYGTIVAAGYASPRVLGHEFLPAVPHADNTSKPARHPFSTA